jgi:hypothetical protein
MRTSSVTSPPQRSFMSVTIPTHLSNHELMAAVTRLAGNERDPSRDGLMVRHSIWAPEP